jgi:hypothetical protein
MAHEQRKFSTSEHNPVFGTPPLIFRDKREAQLEREATRHVAQVASDEQAQREDAYLKALNPPRIAAVEPPSLRQPLLSSGFVDRVDALDQAVFQRGIALDRERLVLLGKARFDDLLALDRDVRAFQRVLFDDLTSFSSVAASFATVDALTASSVPRVRTAEASRGDGADRTAAASITGWNDLWKAQQEPQSVRNVYRFHDAFVSLVFGQTLLERLSNDNRVRSHFFIGGREAKLAFEDWLSALEGAHFSVTLVDPLGSLFAWICAEKTPMVSQADLAKDFFGVRVADQQQVRISSAVWHGFLLGYASWSLWDYVGRRSRQAIDEQLLETWRDQLAKRHPEVARFHTVLRDFFWHAVADSNGYRRFDATAFQAYIERSMRKLLNRLSAIVAIAIDEMMPNAIVARFDDLILCQHAKPQSVPTIERIEAKLATAFVNARFQISVEEVQS